MQTKGTTIEPSTIETIDSAMYDLIDSQFNLHTKTNSGFKKVPVLWVSPERAFQSKQKEVRDSVGKLKLPLITVERSSFSKDMGFKGGFQANIFPDTSGARGYRKHPLRLARTIAKKPTRKIQSAEAYEKDGQHHYPQTRRSKIVYEQIYVPIPVWVTVVYSITLKTEYQTQMNDLIAPFATRTGNINALVMEYNKHRYEVFIQDNFAQSNNVSNLAEDERSFETKIEIKVLGYLLGDGENEPVPNVVVKETVVEVQLIRERTIVGDEKPWESDNKNYREI